MAGAVEISQTLCCNKGFLQFVRTALVNSFLRTGWAIVSNSVGGGSCLARGNVHYLLTIPDTSDSPLQALKSWIKNTDRKCRIPCGALVMSLV